MRVLLVEDQPELVTGLRAALARHDMRDEANVPMVYVSHDVAEPRQLAAQIVMLRQGRGGAVWRGEGADVRHQ